MSDYRCSQCNAEVKIIDGNVAKSCNHDAPIIANMSAIAVGEGTTK